MESLMKKIALICVTLLSITSAQAGWRDAVTSMVTPAEKAAVNTDAYSKMSCAQLKIEEGKLKKQLTAQKAKEADPMNQRAAMAKKGTQLAGSLFGGKAAEVSQVVNSGTPTADSTALTEQLEALTVYKQEAKCKK
jgi:hypothetical protein